MECLSDLWQNVVRHLSYSPSEPMLFSSGTFWALFIIFLPLYSLVRNRHRQMTLFVTAFSFFFYYKSSGLFVGLLAVTSLVDWTLSRILARTKNRL